MLERPRARPITPARTPQERTMTNLSVRTELLNEGVTEPFAGWLLPGTLIGGVLAAALIGTSFLAPRSEPTGAALAPEPPSIGMIVGASAAQSVRVAAAAPAAVTQASFAFGFLEFDWDPNAPGGVPGFDSWPKRDLRVAERSLPR